MKEELQFGLEVLEPRFEFKSLWQSMWDAICWFGESVADIAQTAFDTASPSLTHSTVTDGWNVGMSFKDFFTELFGNWDETWDQYWGGESTGPQ